ncbi:MAG TPA: hypothetical protein DEF45_13530 [Rhodopirellula sp.]|nr:hypothetical protein [Rhodopirellula sp.]
MTLSSHTRSLQAHSQKALRITTAINLWLLVFFPCVHCNAQVRAVRGRVAVPLATKMGELASRELFFLKKVCNPSKSEYETITEATRKHVKEMQDLYLEYSKTKEPKTWPRPEQLITDHLQTLADQTFAPQIANAYRKEITARNEANVAAVSSIVTNLIDSQVLLSPTEMDSVASKVAALETTREATLPVALFYRHMIPIPSPDSMSDILTERQLILWKTQKHPNYNQPWVNYFNSNDFLSSIFAPGVKEEPNIPPPEKAERK